MTIERGCRRRAWHGTAPIALAVLTLASIAACGSDTNPPLPSPLGAAPYAGGGRYVVLYELRFDPDELVVTAGERVMWRWEDDPVAHSVVADDASFDSGSAKTRGTYSFTFSRPGAYHYHCGVHAFMTGTIVVR